MSELPLFVQSILKSKETYVYEDNGHINYVIDNRKVSEERFVLEQIKGKLDFILERLEKLETK